MHELNLVFKNYDNFKTKINAYKKSWKNNLKLDQTLKKNFNQNGQ